MSDAPIEITLRRSGRHDRDRGLSVIGRGRRHRHRRDGADGDRHRQGQHRHRGSGGRASSSSTSPRATSSRADHVLAISAMTDAAATTVETAGRGEPEVVKLPLMRRAMVRRWSPRRPVPCFYLRRERRRHRRACAERRTRAARRGRTGAVPSVNDFILRAVAPSAARASGGQRLLRRGRGRCSTRGSTSASRSRSPAASWCPAIYDADRLEPRRRSPDQRSRSPSPAARRSSTARSCATRPSPCPIWGCSGSRTSIP